MNREERAEHLVRKYADMVTRIGYTWFNNPYDTQDICQNVLLKAMERTEGLQTEESERVWILRVAVNECKNLKKSAWFRYTVGLEEGAAAGCACWRTTTPRTTCSASSGSAGWSAPWPDGT